ncbi:hypothetical protein [Thiocystis violacea]|uniref:hypothetical protein n=1 Tax=Thiocystis violacea TaxID=13725 RepID=UPI001908E447|nr:hypothetical protein [Thiocystis violacea]
MKFAAKRTWPEKVSSWEHEGEAETIDAFAMEFATIEQLAADSEFVVMAKEGGAPSTQFFKVTGVAPYTLGSAEPRSASSAASAPEVAADDPEMEAQPVAMPNLSPVISMFFYMGKVAVIATLGIALMAVVITYLKNWLG